VLRHRRRAHLIEEVMENDDVKVMTY